MTGPLPSNVSFGTVRFRLVSVTLTSGDADGYANSVPLSGITVRFTPSVKVLLNSTASPAPVTMVMTPITCTTDSSGYLRNPGDDTLGVKLVATDDPDNEPAQWTYSVTFAGAGTENLDPFSIDVPTGSDRYLTLITPISSSTGVSLSKAAADTAIAAAEAIIFPSSQAVTYNGDGSVHTTTTNGVTTTYTYNVDGTIATDTRNGLTRTYTYDGSGNLTGIAV